MTGPPPRGLGYHRLLQLSAPGGWRPPVGVLTVSFVVLAILPLPAFLVLSPHNTDGHPVTPGYLGAVNLTWALAIPTVIGVLALINRTDSRWVLSVVRRLRWGWFATCLGLAVVTLAITVWLSAVLPSQGSAGVEMSGELHPWSSQVRDFLLVIVLLTPLQAAGEEFVFRGYLTQAIGSLGVRLSDRRRAVIAVLFPATLFAVAHGSQGLPVFIDRFAFGVVAGVLVLVTGGLEAGIAMHVLNNFVAFGLALAYGDMTSALHPGHGSWWSLPVTLTQSLLYLGLCWRWSRKRGLERRAGEGVLEAEAGAM
ncbi:lysostaphin resistance A-like protein [Nocardioides montaniterrae]